jgi:hypothetical protein
MKILNPLNPLGKKEDIKTVLYVIAGQERKWVYGCLFNLFRNIKKFIITGGMLK